jgi:hypothetical protein
MNRKPELKIECFSFSVLTHLGPLSLTLLVTAHPVPTTDGDSRNSERRVCDMCHHHRWVLAGDHRYVCGWCPQHRCHPAASAHGPRVTSRSGCVVVR